MGKPPLTDLRHRLHTVPDTWETLLSYRGGRDALEGVFGDGRGTAFVARRLAGEPMAELCREFGISRKTGYKTFDRYQECGLEGLGSVKYFV
jgi:hypothetical protein